MIRKYRIVKKKNAGMLFRNTEPFIFSIQKKYWFGWKQLDWYYSKNKAVDILYSNFINPIDKEEVVHEVEKYENYH